MAYSTLKGVNKNNEHSSNEHRSEFGKVLGKTIDIIAMQTALPAGLVNLGMDIFVRATGNSGNGLTYFDATSIGLLTIPVIKKVFDKSLSNFEESITIKNDGLKKRALIGIFSSTTAVIFEGSAAYSVVAHGLNIHPFQNMPIRCDTLFFASITATCLGAGAVLASKVIELKRNRRK